MPSAALPKYLSIAEKLAARIRAGDWRVGRMASVRAVAGEQGVSIVTASRALQVLHDRGLIAAVERSGYYVKDRDRPAAEAWCLLLRVTPGSWQQATVTITQSGFEAVARQEGIVLCTDAIELNERISARDLKKQVRAAREAGNKGLFLMPSRYSDSAMRQDEELLEQCRAVGLPVVLIERNLRGDARPLETDLVSSDDLDGGMRLTNHLLELGRRRIAFVAGSPTSSHNARVAGYLHALLRSLPAQDRRTAWPPLIIEQSAGLTTKSAYQQVTEQLLKSKADGVLCYQDYTAIGVIMELMARGVRVPQDVAVAGFDNLPVGNAFAIGVTTYAQPAEEMARQALLLMRQRLRRPEGKPVQVVVPGTLIVRESTQGL